MLDGRKIHTVLEQRSGHARIDQPADLLDECATFAMKPKTAVDFR
ncbi:hypothetical protein [Labrys sp. LIt4]|nr:hypothetical protein [Labrys sp. LIt4]